MRSEYICFSLHNQLRPSRNGFKTNHFFRLKEMLIPNNKRMSIANLSVLTRLRSPNLPRVFSNALMAIAELWVRGIEGANYRRVWRKSEGGITL